MTINEPTPTYDLLRAHRLACLVGKEAAERALTLEWPRDIRANYERRRDDFALALARVDALIAALPKNEIYPSECQRAFRALVLARRAGQVTVREFGIRARFLRGERHG